MSTAHTKRRKLIAKLKHRHPHNWESLFRRKVDSDVRRRLGEPVALEQIMNAVNHSHL